MGKFQSASYHASGSYKAAAALAAAHHLRSALETPARLAFAFVSPDHISHLDEFCETLRVDGHIQDVVGCTTGGLIEGKTEFEGESGFSVIALQGEFGDPLTLQGQEFPSNLKSNGWILLVNPFSFSADACVASFNSRTPAVPIVGGFASGGHADATCVFVNGTPVDAVAIPAFGMTSIVPVLSQGCRPIGEPFTVTRADQNVVYVLGGQPAYRALESAFETLSDEEKSNAKGNLFAGLAGSEYIHDFHSGDFLVKSIIGADPNSGAVVISGIPRIGQTLQYQLRNPRSAIEDLDRALESARLAKWPAYGSLLFCCLARGSKFFGSPNTDATAFSGALDGKPLVGCFCNGEIGPVRGVNSLHAFTAAAAVFVEKTS
ncbi:MAG: FIST N-terminal domain-containing protein [bacterium]